jgi:hypothetical protein
MRRLDLDMFWAERCQLKRLTDDMQRGKLKSRGGRLSAFRTIKEISEAQLEMLMKIRAGVLLAGLAALALAGNVVPARAQDLSDHAVKSFMEYAWSLTPQQFSKPDGTVIVIDKTKKDQVLVPLDVAREIIKAGRLSAHAQICDLRDDQILNHRAMMRREEVKQKWTPQQMVYISQLHLTTVMLLTGRIRLVEKQGDKEVVVVDEKNEPAVTCTDEQRKKVKELITAYVAASPPVSAVAKLYGNDKYKAPPAAAQGAPTATGSTSVSDTGAEKKK